MGLQSQSCLTRPAIAIAAASIVAFNPQFLFLSAAVNNDNLVTAVSALGIWMCVWLVRSQSRIQHTKPQRRSPRQPDNSSCSALLVGIAALSKLSGSSRGWSCRIDDHDARMAAPFACTDLFRWGAIVGVDGLHRRWLVVHTQLAPLRRSARPASHVRHPAPSRQPAYPRRTDLPARKASGARSGPSLVGSTSL